MTGSDGSVKGATRILESLERTGYSGWDPYDALNGTRWPRWMVRTRRGRQLATQLVKRSPIELRRVVGVPQGVSAYTLGHVLSAQARLSRRGVLPDAKTQVAETLRMLDALSLPGWSGPCWGYHFDVQTRFFFYDASTPNVIVTAFAAKGMSEVTEAGLADCTDRLAGVAEFVLADLPRVRDERGQSIGYIPTSSTVVHNANMLAAATLVAAGRITGAPGLLKEALLCARYTAAHQRSDGAWPYSEQADGRWVDGFHTGFVLEGMHAVARASDDTELLSATAAGLNYYIENLFDQSGAPRYTDGHALPYDALSAAEAIEVLRVLADMDQRALAPAERVAHWALDNLLSANGSVAYRKTAWRTDAREYPRWSAAPMCSALAGLGAS
jgi:hypothetical protein